MKITLDGNEHYDEATNKFYKGEPITLTFIHSLVSVSRWEEKWKRSWFNQKQSRDEVTDYIGRCMISEETEISPLEIVLRITPKDIQRLKDYISDPATATVIKSFKESSGQSKHSMTSEMLYYYMIQYRIPFECQNWHLNRLIMLIQICNVKNTDNKKMTPEMAKHRAALNRARKSIPRG